MLDGLKSIIRMRCPRCRKGKLFPNTNPYHFRDMNNMHHACQACNQDFVIEPGFYFGATYVSYALNFAWIIPLFLLNYIVLDYPYMWFVVVMFVLLVVLTPWIYRISRSAYLAIYVRYDAEIAG